MDTSLLSPAVRELLAEERLPPLGPGVPNEAVRATLAALTPEKLLAPHRVRGPRFAECCLAGLWLYHDFLDESHTLSQSIPTAEGSYWHGLMHRREPDFPNAAYWFGRVGRHPVFDALPEAARQAAADAAVTAAVPSPWDPFWFIDYCAACVHGREPGERFARLVQRREWQALFEYCYRQAVGAG